jgi:hypothetical protein
VTPDTQVDTPHLDHERRTAINGLSVSRWLHGMCTAACLKWRRYYVSLT